MTEQKRNKADHGVKRMYPDAGLKEPVREFENTLVETVKRLFTK